MNNDLFFSDFMDPFQQKKISKELDNHPLINYQFFGGYQSSERKMLGIFYENTIDLINWPILVVFFSSKDSYRKLNHRKILGSIMSLGVTRNTLGDIIVNENDVQIVVQEHIAPYIKDNLHEIDKVTIIPEITTTDNLKLTKQQYKDETIIVNSLRIDGIVSTGWHISRGEATHLVKKGFVSVNHETIEKPSFLTSTGDLISVKGKGRFIIHEFLGTTKKDRNKVLIKKYL